MFSLDQVEAQSFYFAPGLQIPGDAVFPPFVRGIEVLVDMPVDRHGESRTDGGFLQQERIDSIRYQQVVHKIFHGCNL